MYFGLRLYTSESSSSLGLLLQISRQRAASPWVFGFRFHTSESSFPLGCSQRIRLQVISLVTCSKGIRLQAMSLVTCSKSIRLQAISLVTCSKSIQLQVMSLVTCSHSIRLQVITLVTCSQRILRLGLLILVKTVFLEPHLLETCSAILPTIFSEKKKRIGTRNLGS